MANSQIQTNGNWQYMTSGGELWTRRVGTTEWKRADSTPPTGSSPMELQLVRQKQIAGEPFHWSIFLASECQRGVVFQVKGDAIAMHYAHAENIDVLNSNHTKTHISSPGPRSNRLQGYVIGLLRSPRQGRQTKPPLGKIVRAGQSGLFDAS